MVCLAFVEAYLGAALHLCVEQPFDDKQCPLDPPCRASTTLSGSVNHFGRFMSRCDIAYFVVSLSGFSSVLFSIDVVAGAFV